MQTPKEKVVNQTLTLLPVDHPLVRRRISRYTQRMQVVQKSVAANARKSAQSSAPSLKRGGRSDAVGQIPRHA